MRTDLFMHEAEKTSAVFARNHGLSVAFAGDQACTNGKTIYLPALGQGAEVSDELSAVMRGYIDHEAGHVRHTDFDYLQRWASEAGQLAREFQNAIEDIWLERQVRAEYPGAATNLRATSTAVNQEFLDNIEPDDERNSDPRFVGPVAITWQGRIGYGGPTCEACLDRLPEGLRERVANWVERIDESRGTADNCALADAIAREVAEDAAAETGEPGPGDGAGDDGETGEAGEAGEAGEIDGDGRTGAEGDDSSEDGQGDMLGGDRGAREGSESESGGSAGVVEGCTETDAEDEARTPSGEAGRPGTDAKGGGPAPYKPAEASEIVERRLADEGALGHTRDRYWAATTAHDKWHHRGDAPGKYGDEDTYGVKMRRSCDEARSERRYEALLLDVGPAVGVMRRKLERALMASQQRDWEHGRTQGRLDSKRFAAAVSGREAVFKTRHETSDMDTAVSMLVDLSGSMNGPRAKMATKAVVAMSEALSRPGIPFEVLGFNNKSQFRFSSSDEGMQAHRMIRKASEKGVGRTEPLDMYVFKAFGERMMEAKPSLASIDKCSGGNNTDGEAVWKAYQRLLVRPEKRKVMIVFSDGAPEAHGNRDTQVSYLRQVVRDIDGDEGVDCVGIGIGDDAVSRFYEKHVVVRSVEDLAGESMQQLAGLLMGERFDLTDREAS